ncbi:hypothetical protein COOONC_17378 [Cooperia oncophora]
MASMTLFVQVDVLPDISNRPLTELEIIALAILDLDVMILATKGIRNHLQQISSCYCYYFGCDDRRAVQLYIDTLEPELYL